MDAFLSALEATAVAETLRFSRWGYAALNALHILGFSVLIGAILPLDLRLLGAWPGVPRAALVRVLSPAAAVGLTVAILTGALLFTVRAPTYAGLGLVQAKLALVAVGAAAAIALHLSHGPTLERAGRSRLALHAVVSMTCWIGALICGRLIAFVAD